MSAATSNCGPVADCTGTVVASIIRGSDRDLVLRIVSKETGDPFDLTAATGIKARFEKEDGTVLEKLLLSGVTIIAPPTNGKINVHLDDTDTALLRVGENLGFEVEIDIGANKFIVQFISVLTVIARLF